MTPARYHQTGNSRPHVVAPGYQHTPRVSGPITHERKGWIARILGRVK